VTRVAKPADLGGVQGTEFLERLGGRETPGANDASE